MGDSLGHRSVFVAGIAVFGLASLAAGSSPTDIWLIVARAAQGIGAAIIFPASWAMMTTIFPAAQRGFAFGIQTTIGGIFMSTGPLIGGLFAAAISWRWIFWINLPVVAAVAVIVLATWTPSIESARRAMPKARGGFDFLGPVALVFGLIAVVVALMEGAGWGWGDPVTLALSGGGAALLIVFAVVETRCRAPVIDLGLLRIATFTGGVLIFFMFQFNKIIVFVFGPLYLQDALRRSPIDAGFAVMVAVLPTLVTSLISGRLTDRLGARRPLMLGLALNGSAVILLAIVTAYDSYPLTLMPLVIWGATLPFLAVPSRRALMSAVPPTQQSQASGVNLTIQMLGGTIGMAICSSLFTATGSFRLVFLVTGALVLATILVGWLMVERPAPSAAASGS